MTDRWHFHAHMLDQGSDNMFPNQASLMSEYPDTDITSVYTSLTLFALDRGIQV